MSTPAPNSPEFAALAAAMRIIMLEERTIEANLVSHYDLWKIEEEPEAPTMTLDEFMKHCISEITKLAAESTAAKLDNPDDAAKIPTIFFRIEQRLLSEWAAAHEEHFGTGETERQWKPDQTH